ncbi:MAG: murein biosynthesis integral membrane protein MurJ [Patescibacteria group bacterium]
MVRRVLSFLSLEFFSLHQTAALLGVATFTSQFLGLWRDRLLASTFGAGIELDIYYLAFRIPDLIFVALVSLVSVAALLPFLTSFLTAGKKEEANNFLNSTITFFSLIMVGVSVLVWILMPQLSSWVAPGLETEASLELIKLSRIMLLSPFLLGLSNMLSSVTQALRRFFSYALAPIIYNLGIIVGIVFFYPWWGLAGLAWGVVLGAIGHCLINYPVVYRAGFRPKFVFNVDWKGVFKMMAVSWPRTVTLSIHQLILLALLAFGSLMGAGVVSVFNLSNNLYSIPLMIVGSSYAVAAFPTMARLLAKGKHSDFAYQIEVAGRHIIFWTLPAMVLFIVLRAQIVRTVLGSGQFSWSDTRLTAATLALLALSVTAHGLIMLLVRGYYASGHTTKPLIAAVGSGCLTILLVPVLWFNYPKFGFLLESFLKVSDLSNSEMLVLPLAYSIGLILNFLIIWFLFIRDFPVAKKSFYLTFIQSLVASVIIGFSAYLVLEWGAIFFDLNTFLGIFLQGLMSGIVGLFLGFLSLYGLNSRELKEFTTSISRRIWHYRSAGVEPEEL